MGLCGFIEQADQKARAAGELPAAFDADDVCVKRRPYEGVMYEPGDKKNRAKEAPAEVSSADELMKQTKAVLRGLCETAGFPVSGRETKRDLVAILTNDGPVESEGDNGN